LTHELKPDEFLIFLEEVGQSFWEVEKRGSETPTMHLG
jgi:hypothetical protein